LGYADSVGPISLELLVQELCEDHAEKTRLLERVSTYLDKLETMQAQRKQDTENAMKAMQDSLIRGKEALLQQRIDSDNDIITMLRGH